MREILFKAKRKDNNEWIEGYLLKSEDYIFDYSERIDIPYIIPIDNFNLKNIKQYEVIPETICQYTGLKDKNDVKIFENDTVKAINTFVFANEDIEGQVYFDMFNGMELKVSEDKIVHFDYLEEIEKIGNIFDEEVK